MNDARPLDRLLPWIAILLSVGAMVHSAGRQTAAVEGSARRHDAQEAEIRKERETRQAENQAIREDLQYLCNERRRDNVEAGRSTNGRC